MRIYDSKLEPLVKKAVDLLISQGIWTVTYEAFWQQHKEDFHLAIDDYNSMIDSFNLTLEIIKRLFLELWALCLI